MMTTKLRVHELAKELGLSSKETIQKLGDLGIIVKSHSSTIDASEAAKLRELVEGKPVSVAEPAPAEPKEAKPKVEPSPEEIPPEEAEPAPARVVQIPRGATVEEFASKVGLPPTDIIKMLLALGEMKTINQSLTDDAMELLAVELGREISIVSPEESVEEPSEVEEEEEDIAAEARAPVVTVMGHVDHGKSSILQHFRKKEMLSQEAGGITQAIGAYQVHSNGRVVTFIDTPGHEAFTQMRARGAQVTDLAVLVVAADDGVQPQTIEALDHARAAGVPIIVAVNKVDKPESDPTRVRQQLAELGLQPEEWGGDTVYVDVSAKQGTNMDQLLEMINLVSDLQELKGSGKATARGVAIEAHLDKGRGPVATLLVQRGTLQIGAPVVCGSAWAKVRSMVDENGKSLTHADISQPVQVSGWSKVPSAGDDFRVLRDEREAKHLAQEREAKIRHAELVAAGKPRTLEDLLSLTRTGELPELRVIVKADTQGSVEALVDSLAKMDQTQVRLNILRRGVGAITENDVTLAAASGAIVVGFNVRADASARQLGEREGVDVRHYEVIYQLLNDIEQATKGLLAPEEEEVVLGAAEIREVFRTPRGNIAGCYVTDGQIARGARARLVREGAIVYTGVVWSLRRFKDDVREVATGFECGIGLENYNDIKQGDVIEAFEIREVART